MRCGAKKPMTGKGFLPRPSGGGLSVCQKCNRSRQKCGLPDFRRRRCHLSATNYRFLQITEIRKGPLACSAALIQLRRLVNNISAALRWMFGWRYRRLDNSRESAVLALPLAVFLEPLKMDPRCSAGHRDRRPSSTLPSPGSRTLADA